MLLKRIPKYIIHETEISEISSDSDIINSDVKGCDEENSDKGNTDKKIILTKEILMKKVEKYFFVNFHSLFKNGK